MAAPVGEVMPICFWLRGEGRLRLGANKPSAVSWALRPPVSSATVHHQRAAFFRQSAGSRPPASYRDKVALARGSADHFVVETDTPFCPRFEHGSFDLCLRIFQREVPMTRAVLYQLEISAVSQTAPFPVPIRDERRYSTG